jgi:hypothetical protein
MKGLGGLAEPQHGGGSRSSSELPDVFVAETSVT